VATSVSIGVRKIVGVPRIASRLGVGEKVDSTSCVMPGEVGLSATLFGR
jgi:hypothetical protein